MPTYWLRFLNGFEQPVRSIEIEASDDDSAIELSCMHSIKANVAVELCIDGKSIFRATPLIARLYLPGRLPRL
jgi:hypothetical protein